MTVAVRCAALGADAARAGAAADATHELEAVVTDRGRGLTPAEAERMFEPYEAASAARGGGTGLGAALQRVAADRLLRR